VREIENSIRQALAAVPDDRLPRPRQVQIDPAGADHVLVFEDSEQRLGVDRTERSIHRLLEAESARRLTERLTAADSDAVLEACLPDRPTRELARWYRHLVLIHPEHAELMAESAASFERLDQLCESMPAQVELGWLAAQVAQAIVGSSGVDLLAAVRAARSRAHGEAAEHFSEYAEHLAALVRSLPVSGLDRVLERDQAIERIQSALRIRWEEEA